MNRSSFSFSRHGASGLVLLAALAASSTPTFDAQRKAPRQDESAEVAYVSADLPGPGKLGDAGHPFSSIRDALAAGAQELRIEPGLYEAHLDFSSGVNVTLRTWNGRKDIGQVLDEPGELEIVGEVHLDGGATVTLASTGIVLRLRGDLLLTDGVLDITGNTLVLEARRVYLGGRSKLLGSGHCDEGTIRFIGDDSTAVFINTSENRLRFDFPEIEVMKDSTALVTFTANGVLSTTTGGVPANNADVLGTPCFTLFSGEVELLDGLDVFDVGGQYEQFDGKFLMAGLSSIGPAPIKPYIQAVAVGFRFDPGNMIIDDGEFRTSGGQVAVSENFYLGTNRGTEPGDALFSLEPHGEHVVFGFFHVGPDTDPAQQDAEKRNRYFLGGECGVQPDRGGLFLYFDYLFEGTGDRFDDFAWLSQEQGLHGNVFFTGTIEQYVQHRQDEDAFFCDVMVASGSDDNDGIMLFSNIWLNDEGTLTLQHGNINTDNEQYEVTILNPNPETALARRNNSDLGEGVVDLGSRESYIDGNVTRTVEQSNATGGVITGGYLFPVGVEAVGGDGDVAAKGQAHFFRPLILQFPDDLGRSSLARVDYLQDLGPEDCEWPESGLVVDAVGGGLLTLDVIGNQFWKLEFDRLPSFDPNVRVEADGLPNVNDIQSLRLIQWECDCTNPRLAGFFDINAGGSSSAAITAFINDVPNVTQEDVDVDDCNLFGIASDFSINPINILPPDPGPPVVNAIPLGFVPGTNIVTVSVNISVGGGREIVEAVLTYTIYAPFNPDPIFTAMLEEPSAINGNTYEYEIPAQLDGFYVVYSFKATDNAGATGVSETLQYRVLVDGIDQVEDIQLPFDVAEGSTPFDGVTTEMLLNVIVQTTPPVSGIIAIQDTDKAWSGLFIRSTDDLLADLQLGDSILIYQATIVESSGQTELTEIRYELLARDSATSKTTATIDAVKVTTDSILASPGKFDGCRVEFNNVTITNNNPDSDPVTCFDSAAGSGEWEFASDVTPTRMVRADDQSEAFECNYNITAFDTGDKVSFLRGSWSLRELKLLPDTKADIGVIRKPLTVWPGDMNNDTVVDERDILRLGPFWGRTGPARISQGCKFEPKEAPFWTPEQATYADANGDGTIDEGDLICLGGNWGRQHSTMASRLASTDPRTTTLGQLGQLTLRFTEETHEQVQAEVYAEVVQEMLGAAFVLVYPVDEFAVEQVEPGPWLDQDALWQANAEAQPGVVGIGLTRTHRRGGVSGSVLLARVRLRKKRVAGDLAGLRLEQAIGSTVSGEFLVLDVESGGQQALKEQGLPNQFVLEGNYPNPFNPTTTLRYQLAARTRVELVVYDVMGRRVRTLVKQEQEPGWHQARWEGRDESGQAVASGVYLVRMRAGAFVASHRLILLK